MPSCLEFRRVRSEEHTSELQSHDNLVCRLLLEKKNESTDRRLPLRHDVLRRVDASVRARADVVCTGLLLRRPGRGRRVTFAVRFFFFNTRPPPGSTLFPHPAPFRI